MSTKNVAKELVETLIPGDKGTLQEIEETFKLKVGAYRALQLTNSEVKIRRTQTSGKTQKLPETTDYSFPVTETNSRTAAQDGVAKARKNISSAQNKKGSFGT